MAIYHFTCKNVLRTQGKSATAAAACRATEKIQDSYTGLVHDYSRKKWCVHREILLPENAPPEYADRETLWNATEWAEDSPNGRVARELEFSLPVELSREQQIDLAALADDAQRYRLNEMDVAIREMETAIALNKAALAVIESLLKVAGNTGRIAARGMDLALVKIERERRDIAARDGYVRSMLQRFECETAEDLKRKAEELRSQLGTAGQTQAQPIPAPGEQWQRKYKEILESVPPDLRGQLEEELVRVGLKEDYPPGVAMNPELFEDALFRVDERIAEIKSGKEEPAKERGRTR